MTYNYAAGGFFCDGCSLKIGEQPEASLLLADDESRDLCSPCAQEIAHLIDIRPTVVVVATDHDDSDDITIPVLLPTIGRRLHA